jgi:molecular chaperone GrpE
MTERKHERHATEDGELEPEAPAGGRPGARGERASDAEDGDPAASLASVERERDEHLANWKRAQADYQNLRRRLQTDIDAAVQRAKKPLLQNLLLVLDYLEMALATPCTTRESKDVLAGVEMTRNALQSTLERENVRAIPEGGAFDSALHEAVERVETKTVKAGEIVHTLRRGYTADGQVLRPAQVKVAVDAHAGDERAAGEEEES